MKTLNIKQEIKKLEYARKSTNNKREDTRLKAIILRIKGFKIQEISEKLDISIKSISNWIKNTKILQLQAL